MPAELKKFIRRDLEMPRLEAGCFATAAAASPVLAAPRQDFSFGARLAAELCRG